MAGVAGLGALQQYACLVECEAGALGDVEDFHAA